MASLVLDKNQVRLVSGAEAINAERAEILPLVREWCRLYASYSWYNADTLAWQYERTNVGLLAAAAWRIGWQSFEEYAQKRRAKRNWGRADLWLLAHCGGEYTQWIIETKRIDVSFDYERGKPTTGLTKRLNQMLGGRVLRQATSSTYRYATRMVGAFIAPYWKRRSGRTTKADVAELCAFVKRLAKDLENERSRRPTYIGWVFPGRYFDDGNCPRFDGYRYPGSILILREVPLRRPAAKRRRGGRLHHANTTTVRLRRIPRRDE